MWTPLKTFERVGSPPVLITTITAIFLPGGTPLVNSPGGDQSTEVVWSLQYDYSDFCSIKVAGIRFTETTIYSAGIAFFWRELTTIGWVYPV